MLGESVDQRAYATCVMKHGPPLLEGQVGGDDDRALFMTTADDMEEKVRGTAIARHIAKLVQDEQAGRGVAFQAALSGRNRFLAKQVRQSGGQRHEADGMPLFQRSQAKILRQRRLADAGRPPGAKHSLLV